MTCRIFRSQVQPPGCSPGVASAAQRLRLSPLVTPPSVIICRGGPRIPSLCRASRLPGGSSDLWIPRSGADPATRRAARQPTPALVRDRPDRLLWRHPSRRPDLLDVRLGRRPGELARSRTGRGAGPRMAGHSAATAPHPGATGRTGAGLQPGNFAESPGPGLARLRHPRTLPAGDRRFCAWLAARAGGSGGAGPAAPCGGGRLHAGAVCLAVPAFRAAGPQSPPGAVLPRTGRPAAPSPALARRGSLPRPLALRRRGAGPARPHAAPGRAAVCPAPWWCSTCSATTCCGCP